MMRIEQKVGAISCAVLFGIGLVTAPGSAVAADQTDRRQGKEETHEQSPANIQNDQATSSKTVKGEVVRVDGEKWFIKDARGKEIQLHVDQTTRRSPQKADDKNMNGVTIEAMINEQNHALSVSSPDRRDDRHDHSSSNATEKK